MKKKKIGKRAKKKTLKSEIPFGPYIITAGLIYFLFGNILYKTVLGI